MRASLPFQTLVVVTTLLASGAMDAAAAEVGRPCERWPTGTSQLHVTLGNQVIVAASLAASADEPDVTKAEAMIARDASFAMGAGDVGRPFGQDAAGLRKLLLELRPDSYRFDGWDAPGGKENPCGKHDRTVEFSSVKRGERAALKFSFDGGMIVAGKGWEQSMTTGAFPAR